MPFIEPLESRCLLTAGGYDSFFSEGPVTVPTERQSLSAGGVTVDASGRVTVGGSDGGGIVLARYAADGSPAASFGTAGRIAGSPRGLTGADSIAVLPDGSMLVAGRNSTTSARLLKLDARGRIDTAFGKGGVALFEPTDFSVTGAPTVKLRPDGQTFFAVEDRVYLLDAEGRRVTSFADGGMLDLDPALPYQSAYDDGQTLITTDRQRNVHRLALAPDGGAVVFSSVDVDSSGSGSPPYTDSERVDRIDAAGKVTELRDQLDGNYRPADLAVGPDGAVYAATSAAVRRDSTPIVTLFIDPYTPPGQTPDPRLADNRVVERIAVQDDGKILIVSYGSNGLDPATSTPRDLRRFLPDGSPDLAFGGGDGIAKLDGSNRSTGQTFAFGPGGSILLADTLAPTYDQPTDAFIGAALRVARLWADNGPVGQVTARPIRLGRIAPAEPYKFRVTWRADAPIDPASIDDRDLQIVGPDGRTYKARRVGVLPADDPNVLYAYYKFTPPAGRFTAADRGTYALRLRPGELRDTQGDAAAGEVIGHLYVS